MPSWIADLVRLEGDGRGFRTSMAFGAGPRLFGGLIAAQALAAAGATVAPDRLPQSLHAYFIKGGRVGVDIEFAVELTRDGRSFNTRRVTASQDGAAIFEMLVSFHRPETTTDWQRSEPPGLALADATRVTAIPEQWADHFEARMAPGGPTDWPVQPFWFRTREPVEDDPLLRACALTFISDVGLVSSARPPGPDLPGPGGMTTTRLPTVITQTEQGKRLLGQLAKRQAVLQPEHTAYALKRLLGRKFGSQAVRQVVDMVSYRIVEGPHDDVRIELRGEVYAIPEVSAYILQEMKLIAEQHLGEPVSKAVITVPAYFNDGQRQATKDAGRIAGLDVIRIINEPTAAGLAYGFGKALERKVAVYDLGGGTFDISILNIGDGVFEVVATAGDTFLGGEDFDRRVIDWLVFGFAKEHKIDLRKDKMALQRLKDAAEKARCELSATKETEINLPFIISTGRSEALHLQRVLTRAKLEELTSDLIDRTVHICRKTLAESGIDKKEIEDVILVGGMTRMPRVQQAVQEFFGLEPCKSVHPDEVVALGAAIQGASLMNEQSEMLLLDVTPHSLGIMIVGGYFHKLIEQNTTVPCAKSHVFTTIKDNQTSVKILVLQGESERAEDNELLGEFILNGLRRAKKGEVEIEVSFEISVDGIVSVLARDLETGLQQSITVTATSGLTEDEIRRMVDESKDYAVDLRQSDEFERARQEAEKIIDDIEALFPRVEQAIAGSDFGADAVKKARLVVERARAAIASRDLQQISEAADALQRTLNMFKGVVNKTRL